jgi:hypothetical protein
MTGRFSLAPEDLAAYENSEFYVGRYVFDSRHLWIADNVSSELLLIRIALGISKLIHRTHFDVRVLGAVHATLFFVAFAALLIFLRSFGVAARISVSLAAIAILADVSYVAHFNSFYTDAAAFTFLLLTIASALHLASNSERPFWLLAAFSLCSCLLVFSKPQHALNAFILVPFGIWAGWKKKVLALPLIAAMLVSAAISIRKAPQMEKGQQLFSVIFHKILKDSPTPQQDLADLGFGPEYLKYSGLHAFAEGAPLDDPIWTLDFANKASHARIIGFYLRHPSRTLEFMVHEFRDWGWHIRPFFGNYERKAGFPPRTLAKAFALWSDTKSVLFKHAPVILPVWYVGVFAIAGWLLIRRGSGAAAVCLLIAAMGVVEFACATLADGSETTRHLFLFYALTDLTVVASFSLPSLISRTPRLYPRYLHAADTGPANRASL